MAYTKTGMIVNNGTVDIQNMISNGIQNFGNIEL